MQKCAIHTIHELEKINETLPEIEGFFNHLNMEDISIKDYRHGKRV